MANRLTVIREKGKLKVVSVPKGENVYLGKFKQGQVKDIGEKGYSDIEEIEDTIHQITEDATSIYDPTKILTDGSYKVEKQIDIDEFSTFKETKTRKLVINRKKLNARLNRLRLIVIRDKSFNLLEKEQAIKMINEYREEFKLKPIPFSIKIANGEYTKLQLMSMLTLPANSIYELENMLYDIIEKYIKQIYNNLGGELKRYEKELQITDDTYEPIVKLLEERKKETVQTKEIKKLFDIRKILKSNIKEQIKFRLDQDLDYTMQDISLDMGDHSMELLEKILNIDLSTIKHESNIAKQRSLTRTNTLLTEEDVEKMQDMTQEELDEYLEDKLRSQGIEISEAVTPIQTHIIKSKSTRSGLTFAYQFKHGSDPEKYYLIPLKKLSYSDLQRVASNLKVIYKIDDTKEILIGRLYTSGVSVNDIMKILQRNEKKIDYNNQGFMNLAQTHVINGNIEHATVEEKIERERQKLEDKQRKSCSKLADTERKIEKLEEEVQRLEDKDWLPSQDDVQLKNDIKSLKNNIESTWKRLEKIAKDSTLDQDKVSKFATEVDSYSSQLYRLEFQKDNKEKMDKQKDKLLSEKRKIEKDLAKNNLKCE